MAKFLLAIFHIASLACFAAVIAEDILHIIEKPASVTILDCLDQGTCQATLSDIVAVASAAELKGLPNYEVPWIGAFGISAKARPSGVVALISDHGFPVASESSYPLVFGESSLEFVDENGFISLANPSLNLVQISVQDSDTEKSLSSKIDALRESMGDELLVLGVQVPKSAERSRRQAPAADPAANDTESGTTENSTTDGGASNLFNYAKEGGAALFEIGIWSAILFAVAVYFICLYIMKIDEGNDSIIYKATAAKMGKRD